MELNIYLLLLITHLLQLMALFFLLVICFIALVTERLLLPALVLLIVL